jgi:hypothetical protein
MSKAPSEDLDIVEHAGYLEARFRGAFQLAWFKLQISRAVQVATDRRFRRLLMDFTPIVGCETATMVDRFEIGMHVAQVAQPLELLGLVGTEKQFDGEAFAALVAANRGIQVRAFTDPGPAATWMAAP